MSERTLLPCVFCGSDDVFLRAEENEGWQQVACFACDAEGPLREEADDPDPNEDLTAAAIAAWNAAPRNVPPSLPTRLRALADDNAEHGIRHKLREIAEELEGEEAGP